MRITNVGNHANIFQQCNLCYERMKVSRDDDRKIQALVILLARKAGVV